MPDGEPFRFLEGDELERWRAKRKHRKVLYERYGIEYVSRELERGVEVEARPEDPTATAVQSDKPTEPVEPETPQRRKAHWELAKGREREVRDRIVGRLLSWARHPAVYNQALTVFRNTLPAGHGYTDAEVRRLFDTQLAEMKATAAVEGVYRKLGLHQPIDLRNLNGDSGTSTG